MAPIHHLMAHFPIALLVLAFLVILMRAAAGGERARRLEAAALKPLLVLGVAGAIGALACGLMIWPVEGTLTSTMGRNKVLMASWTIAVWTMVLALRWRVGEEIWAGRGRLLLLGLAGFGALLLATTGTLGGHLLGSPSRFSGLLHQFGWSVYQTYYAPGWVLAVMVAVGSAGLLVGLTAGRRRPAPAPAIAVAEEGVAS